ncbi:MAG TPA: cytochrome c biogenesis protein CcsA [Vicinamibacteria bacterium]|nr:cytochrome c biogenesis protein CcsA [Vicinamibacteria bacterium]
MRVLPLIVLAAAALPAPARSEDALAPVREVAIQDGGRYKPLDTFARELARRISGPRPFGAESISGMEPLRWLLSAVSDPERWRDERIVRVTHAGLRDAVGLESARDRYSFRELTAHEGFLAAAERVHEKLRAEEDAALDPVEQEIATLYDDLVRLQALFSGEALRVVPPGQNGTWSSVAELGTLPGAGAERLRQVVGRTVSAAGEGDDAALAAAGAEMRDALRAAAPDAYPAAGELRREVRYNTAKPFRTSWMLYVLALVLLMSSFPLQSRWLKRAGMAVTLAAFAVQAYGMTLRVLISGRAPVTNMYESVVFVGWGAVLFALLFELRFRAGTFAALASALAALSLVLADSVPILDGAIEPLVPVLRHNTWLTLHVVTIMLGYAALFLAMGLAHVQLGLYLLKPQAAAPLKTMAQFLYRSLQAGTLLLAVGILLGGVWASYSWGRFWGWDPKETWSLIALLGYLALLHGRFAGWVRDFGMAVGSIVGFLLVLMAWYGVNYILGTGLHSYGFGSGGTGYVVGFVALELAVIGAALWRRRPAVLPAAAPAAAAKAAS